MTRIDSLVHTTPDGTWFHTAYDASEERLLREMDQAQIERAMLVGLAGFIANEYILEAVARHPDRLLACGSFNPARYSSPSAAVQAARTRLAGQSFAAIKFHPRMNGYDPLDERMIAVLQEFRQWEAPPKVWLDTLFYRRGVLLRQPPVHAIHTLVNSVPELTFMLLHGTGRTIVSLAEAIRDCPNAYIDISFTLNRYQGSSLPGDLRHLVTIFDQRLVFGSDFPEVSIPDALAQTSALLDGLPDDKVSAVLGGNLARILGLGNPA